MGGLDMQTFAIIVLGLVLAGCEPENNSAPLLNSIGSQSIAVGDSFSLTLQATDANGDALHYASDGTVGPGKNPYLQTTPAVFDISTATFQWTPTTTELGDYSLQFTVTDAAGRPLSARETISITVLTTNDYGYALYTQHCATCHAVDGTGGSGPNIRGKDAAAISTALLAVSSMSSLQAMLSTRDVEHIAEYIENFAHIQFDAAVACSACHDKALVQSRINHSFVSDQCAACHTVDAWQPLLLSGEMHKQLIPGTKCSDCHSGTTARIKSGVY